MRIGIYLAGNMPSGGGYQYALTLIESLRVAKHINDEYVIVKTSGKLQLPPNLINSFTSLEIPEDSAFNKYFNNLTQILISLTIH